MNKDLLKVALRHKAVYLPQATKDPQTNSHTLALVAEWRQMGFTVDEDLLHALNGLDDDGRQQLLDVVNDVMGADLNWASLVKGWLTPTGEDAWDHFLTLLANMGVLQAEGTTLPCGHLIPYGTFPLERYNGCPFCGRPFLTAAGVNRGQGGKLRPLHLWGDRELDGLLSDLLASPVPLDKTQADTLTVLLRHRPLPDQVEVQMKETAMLVVDQLVGLGRDEEAGRLFRSPNDVLRYLWYAHTNRLQIIQPRTLLRQSAKNRRRGHGIGPEMDDGMDAMRQQLRLKYDRPWCRRVARWLNALPMAVDQQLESMHPKRGMWVRFIRALRLAEYARRPGFGQLAVLMDRFYRQDYEVWQGRVDRSRRCRDAAATLALLKQRPGLFARCLFSTMLTFGQDPVIAAFREVAAQVPVRLLLSLGAQAALYFDPAQTRVARPVTGVMKGIAPHPLLQSCSPQQLLSMQQAVRQLYLDTMRQHFILSAACQPSADRPRTIFVDPQLYNIPVSVGDRSTTVQDVSAALQGTRFPVQGDRVRLFLQWGKGLPAQHLDMDLSCYILTDSTAVQCAYFNLSPQGARHSGDIRQIPDQVGTAEYIELSLPELVGAGARRVVFACNAYSDGELSPNLMVGWMSAEHPMAVSDETGVAYDPSTVDHMVRITEGNLSKGLVFGVLEVAAREIVWLEMPFDGQTVLSITPETVDAFLKRLKAKPTIGQMLDIKAEAQGMVRTGSPEEADEAYTLQWAQQPAQVSRLLLS